ncbi:MAG: AbrB/MazE/SpoVT family DNA-binding domain-containing protein [Xanthomonadales bacterium]|nr:AbrB/MazE/SpoVT family DNA-binding domain-containing protein [Xanthomonadales bacterium]
MRSEIKRWGNSAAVRLPKKLLNEARLEVDSAVTMKVEDNRIVIEAFEQTARKRLQLPFSEADLVAGLNAESAHADELPGSLLDKELGDW